MRRVRSAACSCPPGRRPRRRRPAAARADLRRCGAGRCGWTSSGLAAARAELRRAGAAAAPLTLNLFDDVELSVVVERTTPIHVAGGYALSGGIAGDDLGSVTLVVNGDIVAGDVSTRGGSWAIHPAGGGLHVIEQADPSAPAWTEAANFAYANRALAQGEATPRLRAAHVGETDFVVGSAGDFFDEWRGWYFSGQGGEKEIRDDVAADLVVLFLDREGGLASRVFAIVGIWISSQFAHEISCTMLDRFSNARQTHDGAPLGVPGDHETFRPADAVRTIDTLARFVANRRPRLPACTGYRSATFSPLRRPCPWTGARTSSR